MSGADHYKFIGSQDVRFNKIMPNVIPSQYVARHGPLGDVINSIATTADPYTGETAKWTRTLGQRFVADVESEALAARREYCAKTPLKELKATTNPDDIVRCGWLYEKSSPASAFPRMSNGALGTINGPMTPANKGRWYWDLEAADKDISIDRCAAMDSCQRIGETGFDGCGYSVTKGKGIPTTSTGYSMYQDTSVYTQKDKIISSVDKCPPLPEPDSPAAAADQCLMYDGRLGRDCIIRKLREAQCSDKGSLSLALGAGGTVMSALNKNQAFKVYQERARDRLSEGMIRDGNTTAAAALANFRSLYNEGTSTANTGLAFAARDLCMRAGTIDEFDFCSEIGAGTRAPYDMMCLQKAFRERGGIVGAEWYPSEQTMRMYNGYSTWGAVLAAWDRELDLLRSGRGDTVTAYRRMMGINLNGLPVVRQTGAACAITTEDRMRRDGEGQYSYTGVSGLAECQSKCCNDGRCAAYTFFRETDNNKVCMLHERAGAGRFAAGYVSGVKQ